MKKAIGLAILAATLACSNPTPIPKPTPIIIEKIVEKEVEKLVNRRVIGISIKVRESTTLVSIGYDTDHNGIADLYEDHLGIIQNDGWVYLSPVMKTRYDRNEDRVDDVDEVNMH